VKTLWFNYFSSYIAHIDIYKSTSGIILLSFIVRQRKFSHLQSFEESPDTVGECRRNIHVASTRADLYIIKNEWGNFSRNYNCFYTSNYEFSMVNSEIISRNKFCFELWRQSTMFSPPTADRLKICVLAQTSPSMNACIYVLLIMHVSAYDYITKTEQTDKA
jgi:hypothetical protein